jgi:alpha-tubulin suppressor-like RCC1 family protein
LPVDLRVAALAGALALFACGGSGTAPKTHTLSIGSDSLLLVDEALTLAAHDENNALILPSTLAWQSSAPAVASVDSAGHVVAVSPGTAAISATSSVSTAHVSITVAPQFLLISTGEMHTCGITGREQLYCWGASYYGELGSVSAVPVCDAIVAPCSATPVLATTMKPTSVAAGTEFTCMLDASASAYCWGANLDGQLGDGTRTSTAVPQLVSGGHQFARLVAGRWHACGITTAQDAYCWGTDYGGQLGGGDVSADRCTDFGTDPLPCSTIPRLVAGGLKWAQLTLTDKATCGLTVAGVPYCWGAEVGHDDGLLCPVADPRIGCQHTPVRVGTDRTFETISIGNVHRCEQATDGTVECWGMNYEGAFGDGEHDELHRISPNTPVTAANGVSYPFFTAGRLGSCALDSGGEAYCWGYNEFGQAGNGVLGVDAQTTPNKVGGGHSFLSLATSGVAHQICAITTGGRALCWGYGVYGQLGNGALASSATPVQVSLVPPALSAMRDSRVTPR